jgi:DNA invertase Pin-like site-specific DNA recombinase
MNTDLLEQARRGDYTGMTIILLIRMSNESKRRKRRKDRAARKVPAYITGLDLDSKDIHIKRCREYIEARGGKVGAVYMEPHTSAWKRRKLRDAEGNTIYRVVRPVYQQALRDLQRGISKDGEVIHGMMCADPDRLTRDNRDLEDGIDAVSHCKRPILELTGTMDLSTRYGQQMARQLVSMKNGQSADTAERVRLFHEAMQEEGIPTGGHRPFGWNEDKRTLHETEAPILKAALLEMLDGRKPSAITQKWNEDDVRTPQGGAFKPETLVKMARNPRVCGYRMVHIPSDPDSPKYAAVKLDADGKPVIGKWDALITPEQWTALVELIGDKPVRHATAPGSSARKYLGVGFLRCGECDFKFRALKDESNPKRGKGFFWYVCQPKSHGGCGKGKINGPEVDAAIRDIVIAKWEEEAAERDTTQQPAAWDGAADLARVHAYMAELKNQRKTLSPERYYADLAELEAEERELVKSRNVFTRRAHRDANRPVDLRADWESGRLSLDDKRGYVAKVLTAVVVGPITTPRVYQPAEERLTFVPVQTRETAAV